MICGVLHEIKETNHEFICIYGNMTIGLGGGIIGNNIKTDENGDIKYVDFDVICNTRECWVKLRKKFVVKNKRGTHE